MLDALTAQGNVAGVSVDGDVVRADLEFEATDRPMPKEAEHARRAALTLDRESS